MAEESIHSQVPTVRDAWWFREGQTLTAADLNRVLHEVRDLADRMAALAVEFDQHQPRPSPPRPVGEFDVCRGRPLDQL